MKTVFAWSFGLVAGALVATACSQPVAVCSAATCTGCCDASGSCVEPSASQCGAGAAMCRACAAGETCVTGRCQRQANPGVVDAGTDFSRLATWLVGDFDNRAQASTVGKLVERHVCSLPGRPSDDSVRWFYVEHVEVLPDGRRDAYFTRVVELRSTPTGALSRASRFVSGHPLASNAFAFNGPKDGCSKSSLLMAVTDSNLEYRQGCDVTFVADGGSSFAASTMGTACTFPGGYIQTTAVVTADGIVSQDVSVTGGMMLGDRFDFRRVSDFQVPDAGP